MDDTMKETTLYNVWNEETRRVSQSRDSTFIIFHFYFGGIQFPSTCFPSVSSSVKRSHHTCVCVCVLKLLWGHSFLGHLMNGHHVRMCLSFWERSRRGFCLYCPSVHDTQWGQRRLPMCSTWASRFYAGKKGFVVWKSVCTLIGPCLVVLDVYHPRQPPPIYSIVWRVGWELGVSCVIMWVQTFNTDWHITNEGS